MSDFKSRTSMQNDLSVLIVKVVKWCKVASDYWKLTWGICKRDILWCVCDNMSTDNLI